MPNIPWTTKLEGVSSEIHPHEIHTAWFVPNGWPGKGTTMSLLLPECELHFVLPSNDGEPIAFVNRPAKNFQWKYWVRYACKEAMQQKAALFFSCDTLQQLERAVKVASASLKKYKRMPLERMYRPEDRADISN